MLFDSSNPFHSFHITAQNKGSGDVRRTLYHITMLSCSLVLPPRDQGTSAALVKENTSTPLSQNAPLQQTTPRILRKKRGIRNLRAAFRKLQRPTASSRPLSTDTNHSSTSTLFTDRASLLSISHVSESALLCSHHDGESVADSYDHPKTDTSQHAPMSARLHRKTALNNLRGAFDVYDHASRTVSSTPFVDASSSPTIPSSPPIESDNKTFDAVVTLSPDCQPIDISLPLPPPLRHEEVVADIPFVPRPLMRGAPVHAYARTHTDLSIPHIWRGRSTRHH